MFEQFFQNLFAPDFAAKAAAAMDPNQFMLSLGDMATGPTISGQVTPAAGQYASMVGFGGMPMGDSIMPWAGSEGSGPMLPKLELGPKDLAALQGQNQQQPRQQAAPSAGIVQGRGNVNMIPLAPQEFGTQRRGPAGTSLGQLIFGR
jgi:hypothetical protein